jgi:hypothetical protein
MLVRLTNSGEGKTNSTSFYPITQHGQRCMINPLPIIFVIDDDLSTRNAIQRVLRSVRLAVSAYASAQDYIERHLCKQKEVICI